jgi:hypothetical protein
MCGSKANLSPHIEEIRSRHADKLHVGVFDRDVGTKKSIMMYKSISNYLFDIYLQHIVNLKKGSMV